MGVNTPNVLFLGKRYYTNRDALRDRYGRIYQLPYYWASFGIQTTLWLIDYHGQENIEIDDGALHIFSRPIFGLKTINCLITQFILPNRYTHVIATGDIYVGFLGLLLAKRTGAYFVFDVYDKYDEFRGYKSIPGFNLFHYLIKHASFRLFASRALMHQLSNTSGIDLLVPNGIDSCAFHAMDLQYCRKKIGLPEGEIYIGYFGGLEPDRGVSDLISALELLRQDGGNIYLLLGGKVHSEIDTSLTVVKYLGEIPYQQMPVMLAACNLLAIPYRRSPFMDAGASNKIAEALACNRPIVATRTPNLIANFQDLAEILDDRLAEPGNAVDIARVIRLQLTEPILGNMPKGLDWKSIALDAAVNVGLMRAELLTTQNG